MYSKVIYFRIVPHYTSVCFLPQTNIMHEYTETMSKYTQVKFIDTAYIGKKCTKYFEDNSYPKEREAKNFEFLKNKLTFYINNHSQNMSPIAPIFFLYHSKIPRVFPVSKK